MFVFVGVVQCSYFIKGKRHCDFSKRSRLNHTQYQRSYWKIARSVYSFDRNLKKTTRNNGMVCRGPGVLDEAARDAEQQMYVQRTHSTLF